MSWEQSIIRSEALQEQGRASEAEQALLRCLEEAAAIPLGGVARIYNNLGSTAQDQGKYTQAERYYRRSIATWESAGPAGRLARARTLNNLASLLWFVGRVEEAERAFEESAQQHFEIVGPRDPETSVIYGNLATILMNKRKWREAEESFRHALDNMQEPVRTTPVAGWYHYGQGTVYRSTGRHEAAEESFRRAQAVWEPHRRSGQLEARHLVHLAVSYRFTNQPDQFEGLLREVVSRTESDPRMTASEQAMLLTACAKELRQIPQMEKQAKELEKRSQRIHASDTQRRMSSETVPYSALVEDSRRGAQ